MRLHSLPLGLIVTFAVITAVAGADAPPAPVRASDVAALMANVKPAKPMDWTRIPWTRSLLDARQTSRDEDRPVFLFSLDGNIETGRC